MSILLAPRHRMLQRRLRGFGAHPAVRAWMLAWLGGPAIGIANGVARELAYRQRVGELTAHQISTATGIGLFAVYLWALEGRWPLPSRRAALGTGAAWVVLTVLFEFGFGRYVDGKTWSELGHDYNLADGRVWALVLAWLAFGPFVVRELRRR